jgi:acyl carrier protein
MTHNDLQQRIRQVLKEHGRLNKDAESLSPTDDLIQAGLTSHASVNVMLALEGAFDIEFPDAMLKRNIFSSLATIHAALTELKAA